MTSFYVLLICIIGFTTGSHLSIEKPLQALLVFIGFSLIDRTCRSGKLTRLGAVCLGIFIASLIRSAYSSIEIFPPNAINYLENLITPLRENLIHGMGLGLSTTQSKLISGIVLGRGSGIIEIRDWSHFVKSGMSHLLVASGAQVSLTVFPLIVLAENLGGSVRIKKILYCSAGILLVILLILVGQEPSILRAITACWLYMIARLINRKANSLNIIYITALVWLWIDPGLIKNLGFRLSYSASWGLIYLFPKLRLIFPVEKTLRIGFLRYFRKPVGYIHSLVLLSMSAQIAVMPVLAFHFHRVSLSGFIANIIALPISEIAIYTALLSALIALVFQPVAILLNLLNSLLLGILDSIAHLFANVPFITTGEIYYTGLILPYIFAALYFEARFQPATLVTFMHNAYRFLHPGKEQWLRSLLSSSSSSSSRGKKS